ncbi:MAG: NAD-dependent dehydratase [Phenylobacterium sp.]|uniref:NAD-dependent epimerase/dehydratase family protein n=1 Tax=Phenylobacterium sp. TaxID=1871053 RepID=UPI0025D4295F|nr:NAD(P)H-binding protein [Phenylobacterium sp.]MBA4010571.1 NAD-dependent dehydratase [Phenylobacterium sp.]
MTCIAILGANGFVGNRAVEMLHLSGQAQVRPIVRRASAAALPRRFDLDVRVADAGDRVALAAALQGCDVVVSAVAGDPQTIVGAVEPVYRAAQDAGVRRLIYLSSASVHGQAPAAGVDEDSVLNDRQPMAYNNAKVQAERLLADLRRGGAVETVVLRPGIVFGPRSQWVGGWADELLAGDAYVVEGARGACNSIYVDNLVHAIGLAAISGQADGRTYLLGDREQPSWRDLYGPVAAALGVDLDVLPDLPASAAAVPAPPSRLERLRRSPLAKGLAGGLPRPVRVGIGAGLKSYRARRGPPAIAGRGPEVSLERAMLQTGTVWLPWARAEVELGYVPVVSFDEGLRRSVAWLEYAGYPVVL